MAGFKKEAYDNRINELVKNCKELYFKSLLKTIDADKRYFCFDSYVTKELGIKKHPFGAKLLKKGYIVRFGMNPKKYKWVGAMPNFNMISEIYDEIQKESKKLRDRRKKKTSINVPDEYLNKPIEHQAITIRKTIFTLAILSERKDGFDLSAELNKLGRALGYLGKALVELKIINKRKGYYYWDSIRINNIDNAKYRTETEKDPNFDVTSLLDSSCRELVRQIIKKNDQLKRRSDYISSVKDTRKKRVVIENDVVVSEENNEDSSVEHKKVLNFSTTVEDAGLSLLNRQIKKLEEAADFLGLTGVIRRNWILESAAKGNLSDENEQMSA